MNHRNHRLAGLALLLIAILVASCSLEGSELDGAGHSSGPARDRHEVLFVGNSYVFVNNLPALYRSLLRQLSPDLRVESVAQGGYRLSQHAADARRGGSRLAKWLRAGPTEAFDVVVLQEQSQLGGFLDDNPDRAASLDAAVELATLATEQGASVVLFQTWGRRDGDSRNSGYETFTSMQDHLEAGYRGMAEALRSRGIDVRVAPVGEGFRIVHDDIVAAGGDPLAKASDFVALYQRDGSHPSRRGSFLAACILAGTVTSADPADFAVAECRLDHDVALRLQDACTRTLSGR